MNTDRAILISLAIHACLAVALIFMPRFETPPSPPFTLELAAPTEQERQDARKALEKGLKQIVRQTELPKPAANTKSERKPRFFSERDQTVLEETRASASGLTQNRSSTESQPQRGLPGLARAAKKSEPKSQPLNLSPEPAYETASGEAVSQRREERARERSESAPDELAKDGSRPLLLPTMGGLERGQSTIGEALPSDIKFGSFTSLNTDRFVHYGFYARFESLFRFRWVKFVRAALYNYQNSNSGARPDQIWSTRLEIVLDRQGHFLQAILHEGSGMKSLDAAPVEAMREVKQVPNPPAEMVQGDGTVRLMYEFDVQFVPQYIGGVN